jgi:hypothetical protein
MRTAIAVAVLLMFCADVRAQPPTEDTSANSAFLGCKAFVENRATSTRLVNTAGFCAGVVHGLAYVGEILPPEYQSCVPSTSTARQLARVIISYIEARPERMHEDFRMLVLQAFRNAWPCKSGR